uniref:Uncharacterized protein n=1 Tax=Eutreptiella gymnastica TaxID=73025 RepID=A0A6T1Y682_9EUGL
MLFGGPSLGALHERRHRARVRVCMQSHGLGYRLMCVEFVQVHVSPIVPRSRTEATQRPTAVYPWRACWSPLTRQGGAGSVQSEGWSGSQPLLPTGHDWLAFDSSGPAPCEGHSAWPLKTSEGFCIRRGLAPFGPPLSCGLAGSDPVQAGRHLLGGPPQQRRLVVWYTPHQLDSSPSRGTHTYRGLLGDTAPRLFVDVRTCRQICAAAGGTSLRSPCLRSFTPT